MAPKKLRRCSWTEANAEGRYVQCPHLARLTAGYEHVSGGNQHLCIDHAARFVVEVRARASSPQGDGFRGDLAADLIDLDQYPDAPSRFLGTMFHDTSGAAIAVRRSAPERQRVFLAMAKAFADGHIFATWFEGEAEPLWGPIQSCAR